MEVPVTVRRALYLVHLYGGLVLGAAVVFVGVTGSAVLYRPELERLLNPEWFTVAPGHAPRPLDELVANAVRTYPGAPPTFVSVPPPLSPDETAMVVMKRRFGEGSGPWIRAHVDPYSGNVLASFNPESTVFGWLTLLHVSLLTGEHEWGEQVVGVAGVVLLLFCVSGLILWWPGVRRLHRGLRVRTGRGARIFNYDLHRVVGIAGLIPLALVAITGIVLVFPQYTRAPLVQAFGIERPPRAPKASGASRRVTLAEVKDIAASAHPEARLIAIQLPGNAKAPYQVRMLQPGDSKVRYGGGARLVVWIDPASGAILKSRDARSMPVGSRLMFQWIFPTHTGDIAGWAGRLVMFIGGLVPLVLFVTGVYVWYARRRATAFAYSVSDRPSLRADAAVHTPNAAIISRIAASVFGGYAFVWGFTTLAIALGVAAGMRYVEAQTIAYLCAFLVFLACFCWSYAASSATRVWVVLAGGGASMTCAAWLTMRALS